ncbi:MAG: hypothetical protein NXI31_05300 [bacterium]|nr:hypothetical protein [bacterium]
MPGLLGPGDLNYDGTLLRFLPAISILLTLVLLALGSGQSPAQSPSTASRHGPEVTRNEGVTAAPPPAPQPVYSVRRGSGEVPERLLGEVHRLTGEALEQLRPVFVGLEPGPFFVFVHGAAADLPEALANIRHDGAPGFALLGRHQVHLVIGDMKRTGVRLASVIKHELVHELLDQFAAPHGREIPRWFHEGLAQHLAGDTYLGVREEDIVWRVEFGKLQPWSRLSRGFPRDEELVRVAYAQSYSYVSWLVREFGLADVVMVAKNTDDVTTLERALVGRTGRTTIELEDAWKRYLAFGSGAWWRVLFGQCFNVLVVLALPVFGVAVWRRRQRAKALRQQMERQERLFLQRGRPLPPGFHGPPLPPFAISPGDSERLSR